MLHISSLHWCSIDDIYFLIQVSTSVSTVINTYLNRHFFFLNLSLYRAVIYLNSIISSFFFRHNSLFPSRILSNVSSPRTSRLGVFVVRQLRQGTEVSSRDVHTFVLRKIKLFSTMTCLIGSLIKDQIRKQTLGALASTHISIYCAIISALFAFSLQESKAT